MTDSRTVCICLAAATLAASLLPIPAEAAASAEAAPPVYLFRAEPLGYPAESVTARFEYRSGGRVLGADEVLLTFDGQDELLVRLPPSVWTLAGDTVPDLEVLVFADGLLLERFDRASLTAYDRVLGYTRPEEMAALSGKPNDTTGIFCESPCGGGCQPHQDYDCDGVANSVDNCTDHPNSNQANCDGDSLGDVCDVVDGIYQPATPVDTCMTDKDDHGEWNITFEHHVEQLMADVSACGSPSFWDRWIRRDNDCLFISDFDCCIGLRFSIWEINDDPFYWCNAAIRNSDFCH